METSNRREFIRKAAVGGITLSAGLAASGLSPRRIYAENASPFHRVVYRELGSTGCKVSEVGFGAMNMRDPELVQAALDNGINYFDTAWGYMNGVNEQIVGQVLKPVRDKVFITTKVYPQGPDDLKSMEARMETSLKRLQTDHVDLMLFHSVSGRGDVLHGEAMKIFENARKKGITRFIGVSTHENQAEVLDAAVESKLWEAVLVGYNYMSPPAVKASIEKTRKAGIGIIGMKNLLNPLDLRTWNWETIKDIRTDKNSPVTPTQALLKWVLNDPYVDTIVPGVTSFEQLAEDVALMGMKMSFDDERSNTRFGEYIRNHYCRGVAGCTGCQEQCPMGVHVNDLNRCLGYAYGYGDIRLAKERYSELPPTSRVDMCSDCTECQVKCVNGLDLTSTINRAKELFA
ncbi:aldo/keto reductase [bacterium]|nr:aldo/keto reductase [bacterium]